MSLNQSLDSRNPRRHSCITHTLVFILLLVIGVIPGRCATLKVTKEIAVSNIVGLTSTGDAYISPAYAGEYMGEIVTVSTTDFTRKSKLIRGGIGYPINAGIDNILIISPVSLGGSTRPFLMDDNYNIKYIWKELPELAGNLTIVHGSKYLGMYKNDDRQKIWMLDLETNEIGSIDIKAARLDQYSIQGDYLLVSRMLQSYSLYSINGKLWTKEHGHEAQSIAAVSKTGISAIRSFFNEANYNTGRVVINIVSTDGKEKKIFDKKITGQSVIGISDNGRYTVFANERKLTMINNDDGTELWTSTLNSDLIVRNVHVNDDGSLVTNNVTDQTTFEKRTAKWVSEISVWDKTGKASAQIDLTDSTPFVKLMYVTLKGDIDIVGVDRIVRLSMTEEK
ncbi:MAG: hypothetical protein WCJ56_12450 [bacterium]